MIVYYIHHHGAGHLHRARSIADHCPIPILGLSTLPRPASWRGPWQQLPRDDVGSPTVDVDAGGTLHWAPRLHIGVRARAHAISSVLSDPAVRLFVSDVSVEAALLARLHGVPVIVVHQPGHRSDPPHRAAYDLADAILAALPGPGPTWWPATWHAKAHHVGALSRFDKRRVVTHPQGRTVVVLNGLGGTDSAQNSVGAVAASTPDWHWIVMGHRNQDVSSSPDNLSWAGWVEDPWPQLCSADVVVTHAGQNALAEVAAARRPAVVLPEHRPFSEQDCTAALLRPIEAATVLDNFPPLHSWPDLLAATLRRDTSTWGQWSTGDGAVRAGRFLAERWDPM